MTAAHESGRLPTFTIGDRYRRARLNAGHRNVQAFADQLGVGRNLISSVEGDKHTPRRIVTRMWAMACGVPEWWLMDEAPPSDDDGASNVVRPKGFEPLTS